MEKMRESGQLEHLSAGQQAQVDFAAKAPAWWAKNMLAGRRRRRRRRRMEKCNSYIGITVGVKARHILGAVISLAASSMCCSYTLADDPMDPEVPTAWGPSSRGPDSQGPRELTREPPDGSGSRDGTAA